MRLMTLLEVKAMVTVRMSPRSGRRCPCPGEVSPSHAFQQQWVFCYGGTSLQKSLGEVVRGLEACHLRGQQ